MKEAHFCNQSFLFTNHLAEIKKNQSRVFSVIILTLLMMIGEIIAGRLTGSLALEADGYHMASHAGALGIAYFAYRMSTWGPLQYRMNFGTGKILSLGGYSSALVLAAVAVWILVESFDRLVNPVPVHFVEAMWVAIVGLVVNVLSAWLLGWGQQSSLHSHDHSHDHSHGHSHGHSHDHSHGHSHGRTPSSFIDQNHQGALMHVLADALTSVLAIFALLAGQIMSSAAWLDPVIGIVGAIVILRWSWTLVKQSALELLDAYPAGVSVHDLKSNIERDGHVVKDLHVWSQGRGNFVGMLSVVSSQGAFRSDFEQYFAGFGRGLHLIVECIELSPRGTQVSE